METQDPISYRSVQYLAITQNWKSNLENFDYESKFFHLLFEDYFVNFLSSFLTSQLHGMEARLSRLDQRSIALKKEVDGQLLVLNMMVDGMVEENVDDLKNGQVELEIEVAEFNTNFADLKKDIYQLVKSANDSHERFSFPCIDKLV